MKEQSGPAPVLSVIIVSYRCPDLLEQCLRSLEREASAAETEIIVVDNASGDGTVERVRRDHPSVRLIANQDNVGFPVANNQAMEIARGRYILLLNPDTVVTRGAIGVLLDFLGTPPADKIVGLKLANLDGSLQHAAQLRLPNSAEFLREQVRVGGSHLSERDAKQIADAREPLQVGAVSGAALALTRGVMAKLGTLDSKMFWAEDLDYCYRAREAGIPVFYLPAAEITHYGGESGKKNFRRMIYAQHASRVDFARKHYGRLTELAVRSTLSVLLLVKMARRLPEVSMRGRRDEASQRIAGYRDALKYCFAGIPQKRG